MLIAIKKTILCIFALGIMTSADKPSQANTAIKRRIKNFNKTILAETANALGSFLFPDTQLTEDNGSTQISSKRDAIRTRVLSKRSCLQTWLTKKVVSGTAVGLGGIILAGRPYINRVKAKLLTTTIRASFLRCLSHMRPFVLESNYEKIQNWNLDLVGEVELASGTKGRPSSMKSIQDMLVDVFDANRKYLANPKVSPTKADTEKLREAFMKASKRAIENWTNYKGDSFKGCNILDDANNYNKFFAFLAAYSVARHIDNHAFQLAIFNPATRMKYFTALASMMDHKKSGA